MWIFSFRSKINAFFCQWICFPHDFFLEFSVWWKIGFCVFMFFVHRSFKLNLEIFNRVVANECHQLSIWTVSFTPKTPKYSQEISWATIQGKQDHRFPLSFFYIFFSSFFGSFFSLLVFSQWNQHHLILLYFLFKIPSNFLE